MKISAVYKITNTVTGDFYIGSSKNVKSRLAVHKCKSTWKQHPNNPLYQDMQKYGVDKFEMQIIAEVEPEELKETEQKFIETLKPTYNQVNAKGRDIERQKEYEKSDKRKKYHKEYYSQLCCYNGKTIRLDTLRHFFSRAGIPHPQIEAKKYLKNNNPIEFYDVYP